MAPSPNGRRLTVPKSWGRGHVYKATARPLVVGPLLCRASPSSALASSRNETRPLRLDVPDISKDKPCPSRAAHCQRAVGLATSLRSPPSPKRPPGVGSTIIPRKKDISGHHHERQRGFLQVPMQVLLHPQLPKLGVGQQFALRFVPGEPSRPSCLLSNVCPSC